MTRNRVTADEIEQLLDDVDSYLDAAGLRGLNTLIEQLETVVEQLLDSRRRSGVGQPTATQFTRKQGSWSDHLLSKTRAAIEERQAELALMGVQNSKFSDDDELMELYDDEMFFERFRDEMERQRVHLREKYFNDGGHRE